jgi:STE24 endopeptidase
VLFTGSKRSSHSNAYFYGFHKNKRIVLFDTLLEDYEDPNAAAVKDSKNPQPETADVDSSDVCHKGDYEHCKSACENEKVTRCLL